MSASKNVRLAWIAGQLSEGKTDAAIVLDCMARFKGVSETTVRKDLKEILSRFQAIQDELLPEAKARFLEIGFKLLEEARALGQYGPAVNQFKTLATIAGVFNELKTTEENKGVPETKIIRDRITQLMKSKHIREQAKEAGIDLDELKD